MVTAIVECTHCGLSMCSNCDDIYWWKEMPFCCPEHAITFEENEKVNAEQAEKDAEREVSGRPWGR